MPKHVHLILFKFCIAQPQLSIAKLLNTYYYAHLADNCSYW